MKKKDRTSIMTHLMFQIAWQWMSAFPTMMTGCRHWNHLSHLQSMCCLHNLSTTRWQNCLWCWRLKNHCPRYWNSWGPIHSQRKQVYFAIGKCPTYPFQSQQPFLTWTLGYIRRKIYQRGRHSYSHHKRWKIYCQMREGHQQFILN